MKGLPLSAQVVLVACCSYLLYKDTARSITSTGLNCKERKEGKREAVKQAIQTEPRVDSRRPKDRISLDTLAQLQSQTDAKCPPGRKMALSDPTGTFDQKKYKIPMVVHQTFKDRCLTEELYELHLRWKSLGFAYYFHTDESLEDLVLSGNFPEFPHLPLIWKHCITKPVVKTDLWRLLLLWEYGGIYADLDTAPKKFFQPKQQINADTEMLTFTDSEGFPSFHFMAAMPKHPLIFLVLQESLKSLLYKEDTGFYNPAVLTGPGAMFRAMSTFLRGKEEGQIDFIQHDSGFTFTGMGNYTMRRQGKVGTRNIVVDSNALEDKKSSYESVNMTHYQGHNKKATGESCFEVLVKYYGDGFRDDLKG